MTGEIHMIIFVIGFAIGLVSAELLNGGIQ